MERIKSFFVKLILLKDFYDHVYEQAKTNYPNLNDKAFHNGFLSEMNLFLFFNPMSVLVANTLSLHICLSRKRKNFLLLLLAIIIFCTLFGHIFCIIKRLSVIRKDIIRGITLMFVFLNFLDVLNLFLPISFVEHKFHEYLNFDEISGQTGINLNINTECRSNRLENVLRTENP